MTDIFFWLLWAMMMASQLGNAVAVAIAWRDWWNWHVHTDGMARRAAETAVMIIGLICLAVLQGDA